MNNDLKAAAERLAANKYYGHGAPWIPPFGRIADLELLVNAYLADLAAREAEERERELPIDAEWLTTIGFELTEFKRGPLFIRSEDHAVEITDGKVWLRGSRSKNPPFVIAMCETTTRGQIVDLLAGLKIPTKGGAE